MVRISLVAAGWASVLISCPVAHAGNEKLLYSFKGGADGLGSISLIDPSGALYGVQNGGTNEYYGTVFKLTPPAAGSTKWMKSVIYRFQGGNDGQWPSGVIMDSAGALYGTTENGGNSPYSGNTPCSDGCGTVFKLTPPGAGQSAWTHSILYSFQGGGDGANPYYGVVMDTAGHLYGGTASGAVFELLPPGSGGPTWTEREIYRFSGGTDGGFPEVLTLGPGQTLYGVAQLGGSPSCGTGVYPPSGCGVVFAISPNTASVTGWAETVLYTFQGGSDGAYPGPALTLDRSGNIYGFTSNGGMACTLYSEGCGTVYKLAAPTGTGGIWRETVLHAFQGGIGDGAYPSGLMVGPSGEITGSTTAGGRFAGNQCGDGGEGCGTVFTLKPPRRGTASWNEKIIYMFHGSPSISIPLGLIQDQSGIIYGSGGAGGTHGYGAIFSLSP